MIDLHYDLDDTAAARFAARKAAVSAAWDKHEKTTEQAESAKQSFAEIKAEIESGNVPKAQEWAKAAAEAEYMPLVAAATLRQAQGAEQRNRFDDLEYGQAVAQGIGHLFAGIKLHVTDRAPEVYAKRDLPVVTVVQTGATEHLGRGWVGGSASVILAAGNSLTRGPGVEEIRSALGEQSAGLAEPPAAGVTHSESGGVYLTTWSVNGSAKYGPLAGPFPSHLREPMGDGSWAAEGAELGFAERLLDRLVNGSLSTWSGGDHAVDVIACAVGNVREREYLADGRYTQRGTLAITGASRVRNAITAGVGTSVEDSFATNDPAGARDALMSGALKLPGKLLAGSGYIHTVTPCGTEFPVRRVPHGVTAYVDILVSGTEDA